MFCRLCQRSYLSGPQLLFVVKFSNLCFNLLVGNFCSDFLFLYYSVLEDFMFLGIYPWLSNCWYLTAGVQPQWIQGDSKVGGRSRRLWKNTYLITDIARLEMDSVVGRSVEKKRLNNLDYME